MKDLGVETSGNWEAMMSDADKRGLFISRVLAADVLQDMKDELTKALKEGTPFQEFKKQARELLAGRGWTGKDAEEGSGQTTDLTPAWRLELIYRQIFLRARDSFWSVYYPTNHMRCRSRVVSVSERELVRSGLKLATDKQIENIPAPAKGFDHSPLAPYKPDMSKYDKGIKVQLSKALKP